MKHFTCTISLLIGSINALGSSSAFMEPTQLRCTTRLEVETKMIDGTSQKISPGLLTFKTDQVASIVFSLEEPKGKKYRIAKLFPQGGLHGKLLDDSHGKKQASKTHSPWSIETDERNLWVLRKATAINPEFVVCRSE